jgi:molybdopterin molybdotransferase
MIDFATAQAQLAQSVRPLPAIPIGVRQAVGRRLASDVRAACDVPPFDKSMMDGYAVSHRSLATSGGRLKLAGKIVAGQMPTRPLEPGQAIVVMTGAPVPTGADAVVMLEHVHTDGDSDHIHVSAQEVRTGQHILPAGQIFSAGQVVVPAGRLITPQSVGLLLETGVPNVTVYPLPRVAVLTTGSELCPAESEPGPGQIRNTNGPLLVSLLSQYAQVLDLGIARDQRDELTELLRRGLDADMLVVTGGVSTGEFDLVPGVLDRLGVTPVFHKVALKPGKPIWFGVAEGREPRCLVFGLPGNPVSSLACCVLFVFQALRYLAGGDRIPYRRARLTTDHLIRGDRPTFWPAAAEDAGEHAMVRPLTWLGSADQRCLAETNCLAYFPRGDQTYGAGESIEVVPLSVW